MHRAELTLDKELYPVITCEYVISQKTDEYCRPTGIPRSGLIEVVVAVANDETLENWATDPGKQMDGSLKFYWADEDTIFKEIKFEGGYCISYDEYFLPLGNQAIGVQPPTNVTSYCVKLAISTAKLTIDGHTHDSGWPT